MLYVAKRLLIFPIFIFGLAHSAEAQLRCSMLFSHPLSENISTDPIKQLFLWEQISNQERWFKPTEEVSVESVLIKPEDVVIRSESYTPHSVLQYFKKFKKRIWLRHPLNDSDKVPYLNRAARGLKKVYYSASRSMFSFIEGGLFSFKLPTNRPHPNGPAQPGKANLVNDSVISMARSKHVREVDAHDERPKELYVLTEVLSVASKKNNAFSIRDLRPLQDGNYYLPAFSIPYAGREIAKINGENFYIFWKKNYGELLGKAKALLVLRYGLQMKTPNAQNWLIQLDSNLKPTGRIFMRDVADSNYIDFFAVHTEAKKYIHQDIDSGFRIMSSLQPFWENSAWQMDEGGVPALVLSKWGAAHDQSYIETFRETLNIAQRIYSIKQLELYLKSEEGQSKIQEHGERKRSQAFVSEDKGAS